MTDKTLWSNKWVTVIDRDDYTVVKDTRGIGVALLPYRYVKGGKIEYLTRFEPCPAHGPGIKPTSITGGVEEGETPRESALRELEEEGGYTVSDDRLIPLGAVWPSKVVEMKVFCFAVNVTGLLQKTPEGDGTKWEAMSHVEWFSEDKVYEVPDAVYKGMVWDLWHLRRPR